MDPMMVAALAHRMYQDSVLDLDDDPAARHDLEARRRRRVRGRQARTATWQTWRRRWSRERRKAPMTA